MGKEIRSYIRDQGLDDPENIHKNRLKEFEEGRLIV